MSRAPEFSWPAGRQRSSFIAKSLIGKQAYSPPSVAWTSPVLKTERSLSGYMATSPISSAAPTGPSSSGRARLFAPLLVALLLVILRRHVVHRGEGGRGHRPYSDPSHRWLRLALAVLGAAALLAEKMKRLAAPASRLAADRMSVVEPPPRLAMVVRDAVPCAPVVPSRSSLRSSSHIVVAE